MSKVLYIGVTSDVEARLWQHRHKTFPGFSSKSDVTILVHLEILPDMRQAIDREKQIKRWSRSKKLDLIRATNPQWEDLSVGWRIG